MANDYRNDVVIYGREQKKVDEFLGGFLRDGFKASVPIPEDAEPLEDPKSNLRAKWEQLGVERWGCYGIRYPDICFKTKTAFGISYLMTPESYREHKNWVNDCQREIDNYLASTVDTTVAEMLKETRPGFSAPTPEDFIACLKFYTPWSPPHRWIAKVINEHYGSLRFYLDYVDLVNIGIVEGEFWTSDLEKDGPFIMDGHCGAWEKDPTKQREPESPAPTLAEVVDGDYNPDPEVAPEDDEDYFRGLAGGK